MKNRKTLAEKIWERYELVTITDEEYKALKNGLEIALDSVRYATVRETRMLLEKMLETISKITNAKMDVLYCLNVENIRDMVEECETYYDFQFALRDLIRLHNASKKVNAEFAYSVMSRKRWNDEYEYWVFQDDEEAMEHINSYKSISSYGMFKFICHIDIAI